MHVFVLGFCKIPGEDSTNFYERFAPFFNPLIFFLYKPRYVFPVEKEKIY